MMPNHGGDPLGPSWDQWGPIGAKKWVKTIKNYHAQKFVFWLLRGHRFGQKIEFTVMAPNHSRKPLESILGPRGPIGAKKMVKTVKNYHAPKFEFLTTPWSSLWAKNRIDGYGAKSRWGPPRVHFGPIGSHWGQKMGQNRTKLPCPKIRIFDYCAVINLCKKSNLRLLRQITVGNPWGLSWGQWGAIGTKKWVKTVKNCHAPKFEFLTTPPAVIDLGKKKNLCLWH